MRRRAYLGCRFGRRWFTRAASASVVLAVVPRTHAQGLEVSGQTVAALACDHETRGGGVGFALGLGVAVLDDWIERGSHLVIRGRGSAVVGAGLVWGADASLVWRLRTRGGYAPEIGLFVGTMGGALIRSIDTQGRLAANPWAAGLAISPLRFELDEGSAAFLSAHLGPTLFREGDPPFMFSLALFEITRSFGG